MGCRFGFLLYEQFEDLDFFGPWEIISLWAQKFNGPDEIIIINETGDKVTSSRNLTIKTHTDFTHCPPLDYLLVPGGMGTRKEIDNENLITFIKSQSSLCKNILAVCTGAFLLHSAGLLNGKKAATHWASLDRLREFNEVEVVEERYIHDNNIWTSAGVSAGIDMALAFVAETTNEETAGNIQLHAEYYPQQRIYPNSKDYLPAYV